MQKAATLGNVVIIIIPHNLPFYAPKSKFFQIIFNSYGFNGPWVQNNVLQLLLSASVAIFHISPSAWELHSNSGQFELLSHKTRGCVSTNWSRTARNSHANDRNNHKQVLKVTPVIYNFIAALFFSNPQFWKMASVWQAAEKNTCSLSVVRNHNSVTIVTAPVVIVSYRANNIVASDFYFILFPMVWFLGVCVGDFQCCSANNQIKGWLTVTFRALIPRQWRWHYLGGLIRSVPFQLFIKSKSTPVSEWKLPFNK